MRGIAKLIHLIGLALFLGSVAIYILASRIFPGTELAALVDGRELIRQGTLWITVPGIWLLVLSGLRPAWPLMFPPSRLPLWLGVKLVLAAGVLVNTHLCIVPATGRALALARSSSAAGALDPGYASAYLVESIAGAGNIAAVMAILALVIWKPGRRRALVRAARIIPPAAGSARPTTP